MWTSSRAERAAFCGLMICVAMLLSYLESFVPNPLPLPGFKFGFANIAVMLTLFLFGEAEAIAVSLCRIILSGLLFASPIQLIFSLCGGILSLIVLIVSKRLLGKLLSYFGVSVLCAAAHNCGQMLAATLVFGDPAIFGYLPWLLLITIVTGSVTGTLLKIIMPIIKNALNRKTI